MKRKILYAILLMTLAFSTAYGQDSLWSLTYGGAYDDALKSFVQLNDGGFLAAGWMRESGIVGRDMVILKVNFNGEVEFIENYGANGDDYAQCIIPTVEGGYLILGNLYSNQISDYTAYLAKIDRYYDLSWTSVYEEYPFKAYDVIEADDGYVIAGKNSENTASVIKFDLDGNVIWSREFHADISSTAYDIESAPGDCFTLAGAINYGDGNLCDVWVAKLDSLGNIDWEQRYGGEGMDWANSITALGSSGYAIGGISASFDDPHGDAYILKIDENGNILWEGTFGGDFEEQVTSIEDFPGRGLIASCKKRNGVNGDYDAYILRFSEDGNLNWFSEFGGDGDDIPYSIKPVAPFGFLYCGLTEANSNGMSDMWMVRLNGEGSGIYLIYDRSDFQRELETDTTITVEFKATCLETGGYIKPMCDSSWVAFGLDSTYIEPGDTVIVPVILNTHNFYPGKTYNSLIYLDTNIPYGEYATIVVIISTPPLASVDIDMIPDDYPVIVEPGGFFTYTGILVNPYNEHYPYPIDLWLKLRIRNHVFGPFGRWQGITLPPDSTIYPGIVQFVHPDAQPGLYGYISYCGFYPDIMDSSYFDFTIVQGFGGYHLGWKTIGWSDNEFDKGIIPTEDILAQNYPNPFNTSTSIEFVLSNPGRVNLSVYDIMGRKVEELLNSHFDAGNHSVVWDASSYSSGVYFYKLKADNFESVNKMVVVK